LIVIAQDSETEAAIMDSLRSLAEGRTSVFVAHRLGTVRYCDKIVVLQGGEVVEMGTHDTLMKDEESVYRRMWLTLEGTSTEAEDRDGEIGANGTSFSGDAAVLPPGSEGKEEAESAVRL
jgi:ABC-type glutathione transport system ATPase component